MTSILGDFSYAWPFGILVESAMETQLQKCLQRSKAADWDRITQKKQDKVLQDEDVVHEKGSNVEERVLSMEKGVLHQ